MFDNMLFVVILTVFVTFAIVQIGNIIYRRRIENPDEKFQDSILESWDKIRPILTELFVNVVEFYDITDKGYEEVENFAVQWVINQINATDALYPEEKALFTKERIVKLIRPRLQEWYEQKL